MGNVLSALWFREGLLYRRHVLTTGFLPIITGLVFFFIFSQPFRTFLPEAEWVVALQSFVLDTIVLTMVISIFETTARFYWEVQYGNGMASLYEMGRFKREPSFFMAQSLVALVKSFTHGILVFILLLILTDQYEFNMNIQAVIAFMVLGSLQVIALSKIAGLMVRQVEFLSKILYLGGIPILLICGLYLVGPSPLDQISTISYYLPPFNWLVGLNDAFLDGTINYGFLFISLIETLFITWLAATFFHLDGDR